MPDAEELQPPAPEPRAAKSRPRPSPEPTIDLPAPKPPAPEPPALESSRWRVRATHPLCRVAGQSAGSFRPSGESVRSNGLARSSRTTGILHALDPVTIEQTSVEELTQPGPLSFFSAELATDSLDGLEYGSVVTVEIASSLYSPGPGIDAARHLATGFSPAPEKDDWTGVLLTYTNGRRQLSILHDGRVFYGRAELPPLGSDRLASLLRTFARSGFDRLPEAGRPGLPGVITLACERLQSVSVSSPGAKPVVAALERLVDEIESEEALVLQYDEKLPATILDWPRDLMPLAKLASQTGIDWVRDHEEGSRPLPERWLSALPKDHVLRRSPGPTVFVRDRGRLYLVQRRGTTLSGPYRVGYLEVQPCTPAGPVCRVLPNNGSARLAGAGQGGLVVSRDLLDRLDAVPDERLEEKALTGVIVEGKYAYRGLSVSRRLGTIPTRTLSYRRRVPLYRWPESAPSFALHRAMKSRSISRRLSSPSTEHSIDDPVPKSIADRLSPSVSDFVHFWDGEECREVRCGRPQSCDRPTWRDLQTRDVKVHRWPDSVISLAELDEGAVIEIPKDEYFAHQRWYDRVRRKAVTGFNAVADGTLYIGVRVQ